MSPGPAAISRMLLAGTLALPLASCGAPVQPPNCTLQPRLAEAGARGDLTLRVEGLDGPGQLRLVLPHPWYAMRGVDLDEVTVRGRVDGEERVGRWLTLEHGHRHAVLDDVEGSGVELQLRGLRAPPVVGSFEPVLLFGSPRRLRRVCTDLSIATRPGSTAGLQVTAPTTATPGATISLGLLFGDRNGNPADAPDTRVELTWSRAGASGQRRVAAPATVRTTPASRWEVPAPPPGVWVAEVSAGRWSARSNPILVDEAAPRELWTDLHGHGARSDGWGAPAEWLAYARDVAFLDGAALSDHSWQLAPAEWAELVAATDAAEAPGRFATLSAMEVNVVGHEVVYLRDGQQLAGAGIRGGAATIWEETDLGHRSAALKPPPRSWVRDQGVLVVPHTSLHPTMGARLPHRRLGPLGLLEVYSAHGSSMERGGWRDVGSTGARGTSVLELLQRGEQFGFLAAGDSHDGRPGTSLWGTWSGGLTAVRSGTVDRPGLWEGLRARGTVASSGRRVHADATLSGHPIGAPAEVGGLRYRVADSVPPVRIVLHRDGRPEVALPPLLPGEWGEVRVEGSFRTLHLEVVLHDEERLWLSPWLQSAPATSGSAR